MSPNFPYIHRNRNQLAVRFLWQQAVPTGWNLSLQANTPCFFPDWHLDCHPWYGGNQTASGNSSEWTCPPLQRRRETDIYHWTLNGLIRNCCSHSPFFSALHCDFVVCQGTSGSTWYNSSGLVPFWTVIPWFRILRQKSDHDWSWHLEFTTNSLQFLRIWWNKKLEKIPPTGSWLIPIYRKKFQFNLYSYPQTRKPLHKQTGHTSFNSRRKWEEECVFKRWIQWETKKTQATKNWLAGEQSTGHLQQDLIGLSQGSKLRKWSLFLSRILYPMSFFRYPAQFEQNSKNVSDSTKQ